MCHLGEEGEHGGRGRRRGEEGGGGRRGGGGGEKGARRGEDAGGGERRGKEGGIIPGRRGKTVRACFVGGRARNEERWWRRERKEMWGERCEEESGRFVRGKSGREER